MAEFEIRDARLEDADEIIRLATRMWNDFGYEDLSGGQWKDNFKEYFAKGLEDSNYQYLVVDSPSGGLAACSVGIIVQLNPAFWLPNGKVGYLQWFSTDPEFRRQGIASEMIDRQVQWCSGNGVARVQLHTSEFGEALYRSKGFKDTTMPNLWWTKPGTEMPDPE